MKTETLEKFASARGQLKLILKRKAFIFTGNESRAQLHIEMLRSKSDFNLFNQAFFLYLLYSFVDQLTSGQIQNVWSLWQDHTHTHTK